VFVPLLATPPRSPQNISWVGDCSNK
jgi:hypothetical protein